MDFRSRVIVDPFGQMLSGYREAQKNSYELALKRAQMQNYAARTRSTLDSNTRANALHPFARDTAEANAVVAHHRAVYAPQQFQQQLARGDLSMQQQRLNMSQTGLNMERTRFQLQQDKANAAVAASPTGRSTLNLTPPGAAPGVDVLANPAAVAKPQAATVDDNPQERARMASEAKRQEWDDIPDAPAEDPDMPPLNDMLSMGFTW